MKNIPNLVSDSRGYSQREETDIVNIQLISWGAHTTVCSLPNANLTILSTTCTTCKPDYRLLPDPEDTLAHSQFSNLSAQQCKTLLFTNTHFSSRSVCWLSKLYIMDLNSPLPPWVRPHTPQLNFTAVVGLLVNCVPGKLMQNWTFTEEAVRKKY